MCAFMQIAWSPDREADDLYLNDKQWIIVADFAGMTHTARATVIVSCLVSSQQVDLAASRLRRTTKANYAFVDADGGQ